MATCAATGEIFETTESIGGRTGATFATMPATSATTALKCAMTYEMVTTEQRELSGATYDMISATCTPTAATFVTIAAISGRIVVTFDTTVEDKFVGVPLGEGCAGGGRHVLPPCLNAADASVSCRQQRQPMRQALMRDHAKECLTDRHSLAA